MKPMGERVYPEGFTIEFLLVYDPKCPRVDVDGRIHSSGYTIRIQVPDGPRFEQRLERAVDVLEAKLRDRMRPVPP